MPKIQQYNDRGDNGPTCRGDIDPTQMTHLQLYNNLKRLISLM